MIEHYSKIHLSTDALSIYISINIISVAKKILEVVWAIISGIKLVKYTGCSNF
jgi:hypothetical protein